MNSSVRSWALLSAVVFLAWAAYAQSGEPSPKKNPTGNTAAAGYQYVGSDTCRTCHEELYKQGLSTPLTSKQP